MDMQRIYQKIAQSNGVSVQEVEREIKEAIDAAWNAPNKTPEIELAQQKVESIKGTPSPEELIWFCAELIQFRSE